MNSATECDMEAGNVENSMECDIYYRVRTEFAAKIQLRVQAMQARMLTEYGLAGALKRRPEAQDGRHTWMEIYAAVPHNFDAILAEAVAAAELPELIDGERPAAYFGDVTACA